MAKKYQNVQKNISGIIIKLLLLKFPILWKKQGSNDDCHLSFREKICLQIIAIWKIRTENRKFCEKASIIRKQKFYIQNRYSYQDKKILFVVEYITPRLKKIAEALYNEGYHITMLYSEAMEDINGNLTYTKKYCEDNQSYECIEQLLLYLIESRIPILHYFGGWSYFENMLCMLQVKGILPKIVFETYDIYNGMYIEKVVSEQRCKIERYCMEHADGVCCREYSMEYCVEHLGFRLHNPALVFLDYVEEYNLLDKKEGQDNELSLCYVGGITTEEEYPDAPYACFLQLAAMCEEQKCHLHVYPSIWNENQFSRYLEFDRNSQYFHFHKPIDHSKLYQELGKYDYGIHPIRKTYLEKKLDGYVTHSKLVYSSTNKYFDYISAGIPQIGATPEKLTKELEKSGFLLRWTIDEYDFDELKRRKKEMRDIVIQNREYWMIKNRIFDLINYYEQIEERQEKQ